MRILAWTLRAALAGGAVGALANGASSGQTNGLLVAATAVAALVAGFALAALPAEVRFAARFSEVALLALASLHVAGHVFGLYHTAPSYDAWVHGIGGGLVAASAWVWTVRTRAIFPPGAASPLRAGFVVLATTLALATVVELAEFTSDALFGTKEQTHPVQGPLEDTMLDLAVAGAVGAAVAGSLAVASSARPKPELEARSVRVRP